MTKHYFNKRQIIFDDSIKGRDNSAFGCIHTKMEGVLCVKCTLWLHNPENANVLEDR